MFLLLKTATFDNQQLKLLRVFNLKLKEVNFPGVSFKGVVSNRLFYKSQPTVRCSACNTNVSTEGYWYLLNRSEHLYREGFPLIRGKNKLIQYLNIYLPLDIIEFKSNVLSMGILSYVIRFEN